MRMVRSGWWLLLGFALALLVVPAMVFAGGVESTSTSSAGAVAVGVGGEQKQQQGMVANPTANVTQTFEGTKIPAGVYRQDPGILIQGNATIPAFFGPFVPGWKVLDDLTSLTKLSKKEAANLGGGAKCVVKMKSFATWEADRVNILPLWDPKTMPEPVGWIFCTASGETTIDVVATAAQLAMGDKMGVTDLVLLKHKVEFSTSGWGLFLNGGLTAGRLSGSDKEMSMNGGGVSGIGYGKTGGVSDDGIVYGLLRR